MTTENTERSFTACRALVTILVVATSHWALGQESRPPDGPGTGNCLTSGCHAPLRQGAVVHAVVEMDACDMCHESSGVSHEFVTPDPIGSACIACHEDPADSAGHVHGPVAAGRCTTCHDAHRSEHSALLVSESPQLCWKCHQAPVRRANGPPVRAVKQEIDGAAVVHGAVDLGCDACHPAHASDSPGLFVDSYPSGPYARGFEGSYALCFGCHDAELLAAEAMGEGGFRDGAVNLHALHVAQPKSRSCSICHDPHAGDAHLVRESTRFGNWDLPIGFTDLPSGGRCATACHVEMEYDRSISGVESPSPAPE